MNKLYSIFTSETVDMVLRKSAAEQLVVVLQGERRVAFFLLVTHTSALKRSIHRKCVRRGHINSRLVLDGVKWKRRAVVSYSRRYSHSTFTDMSLVGFAILFTVRRADRRR